MIFVMILVKGANIIQREELLQRIVDHYQEKPEYLWENQPNFAVFHH